MAPGDVTTLKDVHAEKFIKAFAQHMKNQDKIDIPKWAEYVKTGHMKELGPLDRDWMYVRRRRSCARSTSARAPASAASARPLATVSAGAPARCTSRRRAGRSSVISCSSSRSL